MKKFLCALLVVPMMAHAEFWSGNDLYNKLSSSDFADKINAIGYIVGVYDVAAHVYFCPGREAGIAAGQIRDTVHNWLANNPQRRHELAEKLVIEVLKQAWPCANRSTQPGRGA